MRHVRLETPLNLWKPLNWYWRVAALALIASGLAAVGWRRAGTMALGGIVAGLAWLWPFLWVLGPGLLVMAVYIIVASVRVPWIPKLPVRRTWLMAGLAVLVVGLVVVSILWLPALLVDLGQRQLPTTERRLSAEQRLKAESDART
jgi:hypothetical protein